MSKGEDIISNHYVYDDRDRLFNGDGKITINELSLNNSDIKSGDKIPLKILVNSKEQKSDVRLRFEFIPTVIPKKATTMILDSKVNFEQNETKELEVEIDTKHLVPSRYQVDIVAFSTDPFGNDNYLEGVFPGFVFDMHENPEDEPLLWKMYNWGATRLHDVELKKE